jgi:hypothetical protein
MDHRARLPIEAPSGASMSVMKASVLTPLWGAEWPPSPRPSACARAPGPFMKERQLPHFTSKHPGHCGPPPVSCS